MSNQIRAAIVAKLQADAAVVAAAMGGIWAGLPPEEAESFPFVTVTTQTPAAVARVFQEVSHEEAVYLVKAIDRSSSAAAAASLAALCRTALDYQDITITGYSLIGKVVFLQAIEFDEVDDGITYQHQGGLFEVYVRAA